MSFINISGKKIYYESYGENHTPVLVYLHGGPGASCLDLTNTAKALGKQIKVVSFDQYGVLRSEIISDNEPYTMEIQAKMIDEMRRKMNIKSWSVLGHSYGGALAVLYADKYPDTVDKIILECPCLDFTDSAKSIASYLSSYIYHLGDKAAIVLCEKIQNSDYQNSTPDEYAAWIDGCSKEAESLEIIRLFQLISEDKKIFVDTNISLETLREISDYQHIAVMLCPQSMSVDRFFDRSDPEKRFILDQINQADNPEKAMMNYRKCLEKINSKEIYKRYSDSGFYTIVRDENSTIENTLQKLIEHFGLK